MIKQFVALSGLPRTGSTLLSSILSQNPNIHAEGNSAVCQLMWDMQQSVANSEQIKASNKDLTNKLVKPIPHTYYSDIKKPIVVDKCRSWTLPANMEMLNRYFDDKPKVIVLVRPLVEIVASFMSLRKENGWRDLQTGLLDDGSEPIMRSLAGVEWARKNNNGEFLFVTYDELVDDTQATLNRIYKHCGWQPFAHNLDNIVNRYKENDEIYGLVGQHDVRPQISRRTVDIDLSDELVDKCNRLDEWSLYGALRIS
jgi:sulfotransferase